MSIKKGCTKLFGKIEFYLRRENNTIRVQHLNQSISIKETNTRNLGHIHCPIHCDRSSLSSTLTWIQYLHQNTLSSPEVLILNKLSKTPSSYLPLETSRLSRDVIAMYTRTETNISMLWCLHRLAASCSAFIQTVWCVHDKDLNEMVTFDV